MSKLRITKEFRFEGAHALLNYNGKCKHIHGHSYKLYITVIGEPNTDPTSPTYGMIIDFTDLKKIVNNYIIEIFDHALILRNDSPLAAQIAESYDNVVITQFQPTCENLVLYFVDTIKKHLPQEISLFSIKLHETATSFAEWYADDNK